MRKLQRWSFGLVPDSRRTKVLAKHRRQNAFALKYGLKILTFAISCLLAAVAITFTYLLAIKLFEAGVFTPPGS